MIGCVDGVYCKGCVDRVLFYLPASLSLSVWCFRTTQGSASLSN